MLISEQPGFDEPFHAMGGAVFARSGLIRVRYEIRNDFHKFYDEQIKPQL